MPCHPHTEGLGLVDFNYPQHLKGITPDAAKAALDEAGLQAGAVCMRYEKAHQKGAFTHPDEAMRRQAIEMTIDGGKYAQALGANELVIWSAFDGYDYHHQADYLVLWRRVVEAFREVCDALPDVRVSLEFKPTDENTRCLPRRLECFAALVSMQRPLGGLLEDPTACTHSYALALRARQLLRRAIDRLGAAAGARRVTACRHVAVEAVSLATRLPQV